LEFSSDSKGEILPENRAFPGCPWKNIFLVSKKSLKKPEKKKIPLFAVSGQ